MTFLIDTDALLESANNELRALLNDPDRPWHGVLTTGTVEFYVDSDGEDSLLARVYWPETLTDIDLIVEKTRDFSITVADTFREAKIPLHTYVWQMVERTENTDNGEE